MIRYDIVLYAGEQECFINELRELGLVDITTSGWEPSENDRSVLLSIEAHNKAVEYLKDFSKSSEYDANAQLFANGEEAYEAYVAAREERTRLQQEMARLQKLADDIAPWGRYSEEDITKLAERGITLRYFTTQPSTFDKMLDEWSETMTISEIARTQSTVYFVVVATDSSAVVVDGQEVRLPSKDSEALKAEIAELAQANKALDATFSRAAASVELIEDSAATIKEQLQGLKVDATAQREADGELIVLEGWAEADTAEKVDKMLEEYPNLVFMKRDATIDDEAPVKLKNNKFARLFELIGSMYSLPKYGTLDLTAIFGPFYMLFFAICLCDAGYGLILLLVGLALLKKGGAGMRQAAWLSIVCSSATVAFGFYANSFFGMTISDFLPIHQDSLLNFQEDFFSISLALGVFQILVGMAINIWMKSKLFGFTSTFGLLGWFIILLSGSLAVGLPMFGLTIPGFDASSPIFYGALGLGAVLMLLLNNVKRNPLINIGAGLWDTYNNITGLLSDVLSYIRLFAIGLSGGVLAQVFNSLAMGLSGLSEGIAGSAWYVVVLQIVAASIILLIGHGINLFMSAISSFVHPMRLTFVEFYKNAGFEMGQRSFEPIRKMNK
ncbi:MAG: V-type ATP synthase subunit I [Rikenellaceae bacterium]|nr:V-type ATP synthase subunit I [Rikenellaceae bacterium]